MRSIAISAVSLTALLLTACAATGRGTEYCAVARPIYTSRADVLTDPTARQILGHNETWAAVCR